MGRFFGKSVNKLLSYFKSLFCCHQKISPQKNNRFDFSIRIEKEGREQTLLVPEFEKFFGITFSLHLTFNPGLFEKILRKTKKLYKKGELSRQQIWLGSYFRTELSSDYIPDIVIRYINPILGWGVFANRDFKKMEFIAEYSGIVRKRKRRDRKNAYCFEYVPMSLAKTSWIIDAREQGGISRYINHSVSPNLISSLATIDGISHVILITNEPIQKGTQLSYNYGPDYWSCRNSPLFF